SAHPAAPTATSPSARPAPPSCAVTARRSRVAPPAHEPSMSASAKTTDKTTEDPGPVSAEGPQGYINRELSWLKFNERVLEEALDEKNPLLERVNFLSIFGSNVDEFFMIRVSGLRRQMQTGVLEAPPDGMSPA